MCACACVCVCVCVCVYSPLSSRLNALLSHVIQPKCVTSIFTASFLTFTEVVYLQRCLVVTWLVPHETVAFSAYSVYTIQLCTMSRHFMQSHIRSVFACLAVTCHVHFWQNDRDHLRVTAVKEG